jgi:hypothetical protein
MTAHEVLYMAFSRAESTNGLFLYFFVGDVMSRIETSCAVEHQFCNKRNKTTAKETR